MSVHRGFLDDELFTKSFDLGGYRSCSGGVALGHQWMTPPMCPPGADGMGLKSNGPGTFSITADTACETTLKITWAASYIVVVGRTDRLMN